MEYVKIFQANIPGLDAVQELAACLAKLSDSTSLHQDQVNEIIHLWQAMEDFDKRRIAYPSRHQQTLKKGRFAYRKSTIVPGADSVKRYYLFILL